MGDFWTNVLDEIASEKGDKDAGQRFGMSQSKASIPPLQGPAVGIMGPPPAASVPYKDVSGMGQMGGLMSPMGQGMPSQPGPPASQDVSRQGMVSQPGMMGLMSAAQSQPKRAERNIGSGFQMNEYLRGLING